MKKDVYQSNLSRSNFSIGRGLVFLFLALVLGYSSYYVNQEVQADSATKQGSATKPGKGAFKVIYEPVKNKNFEQWRKELAEAKLLEALAKDLNETFALPKDVTLTFAECGTVNAFYDPQKAQISICYELIENLYDTFKDIAKSEEELDERVFGATIFIFYHEIGHAFVDVYSLPITGKEEDAVDQLSTFILADGTDEGEATALNGADSFLLEAQKDKQDVEDLPFYDEHSLNEQRFYNIICWIYGQNEQKYAVLVKEGLLPEERAVRCNDEYRKLAQAWSTLLKPYTK